MNDIKLPANLPEHWEHGQIIAPTGAEVGLEEQYGYNYLMKQVNDAQRVINAQTALISDLREELENKANIGQPVIYDLELSESMSENINKEYWKSQEGIVTVSFSIITEEREPLFFSHLVIAYLPEGFRPEKDIQVPINFSYNAESNSGGGHGYVKTTGEITAWCGRASEFIAIHANFSFLAAQ